MSPNTFALEIVRLPQEYTEPADHTECEPDGWNWWTSQPDEFGTSKQAAQDRAFVLGDVYQEAWDEVIDRRLAEAIELIIRKCEAEAFDLAPVTAAQKRWTVQSSRSSYWIEAKP